eukprot:TRINITY_DN2727_c0_g2_i4.p1 TRINITY_DN2727_c0_g2~~TRINITY_DN2727_c0_g2_i4.p1  ORF type:complete len:311 (+),score=41.02 TRINITY_DN2727_c0_g2_i4:225-1157(+)
MAFTADQIHILRTLVYISSSISLVSCFCVVSSFFLFPKIRSMSLRIVFFLALNCLFASIAFLLNASYPSSGIDLDDDVQRNVCQVQAGMIQFFNLGSMMWMMATATLLFMSITQSQQRVESPERAFHFVSWGFPLASMIAVYSRDEFGPAGLWCWIIDTADSSRFVFFYVPMFLSLFVNIVLYAYSAHYLGSLQKQHENLGGSTTAIAFQFRGKLSRRLMRIILAFLFCWFWPAVNRIQNWADPDHPKFWLFCLHALSAPSFGFATSLVYGTSKKVKSQFKKLFKTVASRFSSRASGQTSTARNSNAMEP